MTDTPDPLAGARPTDRGLDATQGRAMCRALGMLVGIDRSGDTVPTWDEIACAANTLHAESNRRGAEIARLTAERDRLRAMLAADKTTNQPARPAEE